MKKLTYEEFVSRVEEIHGNKIVPVGEYKGRKEVTQFIHKVETCGRTFETIPESIFRGRGCNLCAKNTTKTTMDFSQEIELLTGGEYELKSEYLNNNTHVEILHTTCGNSYKVRPLNFTKGRRCPMCVTKGRTEKEIYKVLKNAYGKEVKSQFFFKDLKSAKGVYLRYDILLNLNGIKYLIEYNGEQHYKPMRYRNALEKFELTKLHDKMKRQHAEKNGYVFIEIPHYEDWSEVLERYNIKVKI